MDSGPWNSEESDPATKQQQNRCNALRPSHSHPPAPGPGKNCVPRNPFLAPKRLAAAGLGASVFSQLQAPLIWEARPTALATVGGGLPRAALNWHRRNFGRPQPWRSAALLRLPSLCRPVLPQLPPSSSVSSHLGWEPLGPCPATRGPRVLMPALCTPGPARSTHVRPPRRIQTWDCVFSPGAGDCVTRESAIPRKTRPRQAAGTCPVSSPGVRTTGQG